MVGRKLPLEVKCRWAGVIGLLAALALILLIAIVLGWSTQSGIFAKHEGGAVTSRETTAPQ